MPREGVPYPERLLCSLRCELKNIWNALNGKLHSVNGVEGDGAGNVNIVSGDAAVVVTPQPLSNQVKISLDQSQLPTAAVTSVNGQTEVVVLDGGDIEGVTPGQTVNQEITALTGAVSGLGGLISAETTNRQNADSALQTNINTVSATASNKVDKLTTAGPHVYTHYGSAQGELKYSTAIDYNSVAVRDNGGRFKVEDPVSGDTSKNVVTANWVSQTGDSSPNNLMHRTGDETKAGKLNVTNTLTLKSTAIDDAASPAGYYEFPNLHIDDKNDLRATSIWAANNGSTRSLQLRRGYNYNGRKNCDLQIAINESTGLIIVAVQWGDGQVTELARHQL